MCRLLFSFYSSGMECSNAMVAASAHAAIFFSSPSDLVEQSWSSHGAVRPAGAKRHAQRSARVAIAAKMSRPCPASCLMRQEREPWSQLQSEFYKSDVEMEIILIGYFHSLPASSRLVIYEDQYTTNVTGLIWLVTLFYISSLDPTFKPIFF